MQCKYCGADLQEGAAFCMNCGKSCEVVPPVQPMVQTTGVVSQQPVNSTMQNGMQPMNNQNSNKKMYMMIGGIILVAAIAIVLVLVFYDKGDSTSPSSSSNTQSNSNTQNNTNTNTNTNSNSNSNLEDNTVTVSGGEIEFNGYQFTIPSNYKAEVSHWEYLGDKMYLDSKENYSSFNIEVEETPYSEMKANNEELKKEISSYDYYTVGEFQYKTYDGKEYMIISRTSKSTSLTHMIAYVALSETETLVIDGTNMDYKEDYELFNEIAPIIASAHK